jgi:hypothetical protein
MPTKAKPRTDHPRTQPKVTDPSRPKPRKNLDAMSEKEREQYLGHLHRIAEKGGRRTRVTTRSKNPRKRLPPICGCPLDKPIQPGSDDDYLTPREIRLYGIQDTYLSICTRYAGANTDHEGTGYCSWCESKTKKRMARNKDTKSGKAMTAAQLRRFHGEVMRNRDVLGSKVDIGPHEALLDEVQRTAGSVAWCESLIQNLGNAREAGEEYQVLLQMSKMGMEPSAIYQIYQWERDHLITASKAAIACGVAERRVRMAEDQGRLLVMVIQAFVHDPQLGLSPGQLQAAPEIIRKHMLALPTADSPGQYLDQVINGQTPTPTYINATSVDVPDPAATLDATVEVT